MKRLKKAMKKNLSVLIIPAIAFLASIIGIIVYLSIKNDIAFIISCVFIVFFIISIFVWIGEVKDSLNGICHYCNESMNGEDVLCSWETVSIEQSYDKDGSYKGITKEYTCTITCPHCGETNVFEKKFFSKNDARCDIAIEKYLNRLITK